MTTLPADAHPATAHLTVDDADRAARFYGDLLGFDVTASADGTQAVRAGGRTLLRLTAEAGLRLQRPGETGLFHVAIRVPDRPTLGALAAHLRDAGVPMAHSDHAVSESLYFTDPDGHGLEVYRDRDRRRWRWTADGQVHMVTEPLDLEAVLAAADGPWQGMPAGTDVGHLHLQVDELATARAFLVDVLGFAVTLDAAAIGAVFVAAGGYHHHVGANVWRARGGRPAPPEAARLAAWDLAVADDDARAAVVERAERARWPVRSDDDGATRVDGPWGVAVRLVADG